MKNIDKQIKEAEAYLKSLREAKEEIDNMPLDKKLAIALHEKLCKSNHCDQCSWLYEIKGQIRDWDGHAHSEYLKKAQRLCGIFTEREIEIFIEILEKI